MSVRDQILAEIAALPDEKLSQIQAFMHARSDAPAAPLQIRNGSALVAYWKSSGVVGCRADIKNSAHHARALRRKSELRMPKARAR